MDKIEQFKSRHNTNRSVGQDKANRILGEELNLIRLCVYAMPLAEIIMSIFQRCLIL